MAVAMLSQKLWWYQTRFILLNENHPFPCYWREVWLLCLEKLVLSNQAWNFTRRVVKVGERFADGKFHSLHIGFTPTG